MTITILKVATQMLVWIMGCLLFDFYLRLEGPWLMLGGAATYAAFDLVGECFKWRAGVTR